MSGFASEAMVDLTASLMRKGGAQELLTYLATRVPHRYTALYRACGDRLLSVVLLDKLGIRPLFLHDIPMDRSYCQYAMRDGSFQTDDARVDTRLTGHPLQQLVVAYFSIPVVDATGELLGTVCHFDTESRPLPDLDFELLRIAAGLLSIELLDAQAIDAVGCLQDAGAQAGALKAS